MITIVPSTGSTNADLLARADWVEGAWLVACRQSDGRGRTGRKWCDGQGNFMGSTVALLRPGDPPAQTLALAAGLAVFEAVEAQRPPPAGLVLKWPNDLLVGDAKLGGILLEREGQRVVVGIGVNLAGAPDDCGRATTSLAEHGGAPPLERFAEAVAASFAAVLGRWHAGEWPALRAEWLARAHRPGSQLAVRDAGHLALVGDFLGVDDAGAALLRLADGGTRVIHAGEVELVGQRMVGGDAAGG